jgi:hypothetical protein
MDGTFCFCQFHQLSLFYETGSVDGKSGSGRPSIRILERVMEIIIYI